MPEIDEYDYDLPRGLIAQRPLAKRDDARMLVVNRSTGSLDHHRVRDLPQLLVPSDCLVLNDTRVVPARLVGRRKKTGGRWSGLFLADDGSGNWMLVCKTRGRLQPGETVVLVDRFGRDDVELLLTDRLGNGNWTARAIGTETSAETLERVGRVPLPPYIRGGEMIEADRDAYQTVYAERTGAVAAPTAGLHFTDALLRQIKARGIEIQRITLHVGLGTFRPVTAERLADHPMHDEYGCLSAETAGKLNSCRQRGGRIVAVGTTSARVLETAARDGKLIAWVGRTDLFIRPPYKFRAVDALLTNFHLPRSTLLVLVRTFGGDELIRRAYAAAIRERYRFFSYGDAMLIV